MICEAALCTPRRDVSASAESAHSIDLWPRGGQESRGALDSCAGLVGRALDGDFELLVGRSLRAPVGPSDGPDQLLRLGLG